MTTRMYTSAPRRHHRCVALWLTAAMLLVGAVPASAQEQIEYYGLDALGSVRVIFDGQGNQIDRMDYGPFGENLKAAFKFPAEQFAQLARDAESGQDHAQARHYLSRTGRFNATDPVYAGLFQPQAWNRYAYALNRPSSLIDPNGENPALAWAVNEFLSVAFDPNRTTSQSASIGLGSEDTARTDERSDECGGRCSPADEWTFAGLFGLKPLTLSDAEDLKSSSRGTALIRGWRVCPMCRPGWRLRQRR